MKRCLLVSVLAVLLVGCSGQNEGVKSQENSAKSQISQEKNKSFEIFESEYVQLEVARLQKQVDAGEITESQAGEELKRNIAAMKKLNDGSIESILLKVKMMDELLAEQLELRIREHHPELFE